MPVLSIIVPVYNVATYLREGLDSILRQEVQDIEVICVDDCSSDSSPDILKEYQAKDNRIQFIRQSENKGPSATRNIGIKYAKGKYIAFFDPDDKVENNLYAELIHAIEDKKNRFGFMWLFYIPHSSDTHTEFQTIPCHATYGLYSKESKK